jgi:hypothetical protein
MKILTFIFVILSINYTNAEDLEPESLLQLRKLLQLNKNYYNNCPNREKEWMTRCDTDAADDWDIEGEQVFIILLTNHLSQYLSIDLLKQVYKLFSYKFVSHYKFFKITKLYL